MRATRTIRLDAPSTILDAIGDTPMVELRRFSQRARVPTGTRILAKAEHLNPSGSGKDRLAVALVEEAERNGLPPGGVLVEATSGNTGIALATVAAVKGYELHVVCSTKVSAEKVAILRALGAEVHVTPNVPHGDPRHYTEAAERLAREIPGAVFLDQFHSAANLAVHERTTGPELLRQASALAGRLDAFVCGVGTGGSLGGVARYLRSASPTTRIVLADPEGSVLAAGGASRPYLVEGIGDDHPPALHDPELVDEAVTVSDAESFRCARDAARLEGLLVGGSSGSHLAACLDVARRMPEGSVIATLLPDTGRNYVSKFLDAAWCRTHGVPAAVSEATP